MVPAAVATDGMPSCHETLQNVLSSWVVIQIPTPAITWRYSIRARRHVDGKRTLIEHTQLLQIKRRLLGKK